MRAVAPYMEAEPFYESPEEWETDRNETEEPRRDPRIQFAKPESVKETVMSSRVRKPIADLIEELKNWLPNYDHGPNDYPTTVFRVLAGLPGGDRLEDMGYEPFGGLGWHEADQLGRILTVIQDKTDVEDLIAGLTEEEEEEREPEPAPAPPPAPKPATTTRRRRVAPPPSRRR
jgi:hypothetical protein